MPFTKSDVKNVKTIKKSSKNLKKSNQYPRASFMMTPDREKMFKKAKKEFNINTNVGLIDKALDEMLAHPENFRSNSIHKSSNGNLKEQLNELKKLLPQESETIINQGNDITQIKNELTYLKESLNFLTRLIAELNPKAMELFDEREKNNQFFKEEF